MALWGGGGSLQGFSEVIFSQLFRKSWTSSHNLVSSPTRSATSQTSVRYLFVTKNKTRIHLQQLQSSKYFHVSTHSLKEAREGLLNSSVWRDPFTQKNGKRRSRRHSKFSDVFCVTATSTEAVASETLLEIVALVRGTSDICRNFIQGKLTYPAEFILKTPWVYTCKQLKLCYLCLGSVSLLQHTIILHRHTNFSYNQKRHKYLNTKSLTLTKL